MATGDKLKAMAKEAAEKLRGDKAQELKGKAEQAAEQAGTKAKEMAERAAEKVKEAIDKERKR